MAFSLKKLFHKSRADKIYCAAVVPAAGNSVRMGEDKLLLDLHGQPVLLHTLQALEVCSLIQEIVVVTRGDLIVPISRICADCNVSKVKKIVVGGATRALSVYAGVCEVSDSADLIAIHDGARPLVSCNVIEDAIRRAAQCGAAAPAVPVKDTIKIADNGIVQSTPDRSKLFAVQTPQVFSADLIRVALKKALEDGAELTDDCSAVERLGIGVALTEGSYKNIKITTPEDKAFAEAILNWEDDS